MLVRDMLFNEGRRDEQLLAVLAPVFSFTLLSDIWFRGKHEFPIIGELPFITCAVISMNGPTLADLCPRNLEDPRRPC
jgi:hypothetical protein